MTWAKKLKPHLINNVSITNEAFEYILENRYNKHEPIYRIIDRIMEQHKQFIQQSNEDIELL
jgi:hypothetical protein